MATKQYVPYRAFKPESDLIALLKTQYLQPGETLRWTSGVSTYCYLVVGRKTNGKRRRHWPLWLRVLLYPCKLVWSATRLIGEFVACLATFDFSGFPSGYSKEPAPGVIVFGDQPECMALSPSRHTLMSEMRGVWSMTDRRFARLTFESALGRGQREPFLDVRDRAEMPVEPMKLRTEFEIPVSQIQYYPDFPCQLPEQFTPRDAIYHRIILPDGSGFDFSPNAAVPPDGSGHM